MTAPDWTPGGTRLARVLKTLLTDRKLAAGLEEVRTMGTADDRRFQVLRAIVADFVATKEPIGSKALVERHNLGVSSATVRNDMAVLEAEGYIAQPHTSSGRVPT